MGSAKFRSQIEAILFVAGEPLTLKKLTRVIGISQKDLLENLEDLKTNLTSEERGLSLIFNDKKVQLVTKGDHNELISQFIKKEFEEELSPASLETLSIISYKGPISRFEIENLRGVNCALILRNLLLLGLIEREEASQVERAYLYKISFDFLRRLGLSQITELPKYHQLNRSPESSS